MARRKGEITGATNERDFPHVVELALPPDGFKSETELDAFHLERELQVRLAVASRSRAILPALLLSRPRNRRRVPRWFGGERLTYSPPKRTAAQTYEPRVFEGRVMLPDEIERIHQEILEFEMIETVSDPMRQLIEDLWPELVHKLPPKT